MTELSKGKCVACNAETPQMSPEEIQQHLPELPGWQLTERDGEKRLVRLFTFPDFGRALEFTNQVGRMAEAEDHHPMILTEWGKVTVVWWTHKIHGLHMNDFIMASRTSDAYEEQKADQENAQANQ